MSRLEVLEAAVDKEAPAPAAEQPTGPCCYPRRVGQSRMRSVVRVEGVGGCRKTVFFVRPPDAYHRPTLEVGGLYALYGITTSLSMGRRYTMVTRLGARYCFRQRYQSSSTAATPDAPPCREKDVCTRLYACVSILAGAAQRSTRGSRMYNRHGIASTTHVPRTNLHIRPYNGLKL